MNYWRVNKKITNTPTPYLHNLPLLNHRVKVGKVGSYLGVCSFFYCYGLENTTSKSAGKQAYKARSETGYLLPVVLQDRQPVRLYTTGINDSRSPASTTAIRNDIQQTDNRITA